MIKSMTGFASASVSSGGWSLFVEIRAYNSRHLDLALRLSPGYGDLEERARALIAARLTRGRVEAKIQIEDTVAAGGCVEADVARAQAVRTALEHVRAELGLSGPVTLEMVVGAGGILKTVQPDVDLAAAGALLEEVLAQALENLDGMRTAEGSALSSDLSLRLDAVEAALVEIARHAEGLPAAYQDRLKDRLAVLTQGLIEIDPLRIAQETAVLADRCDISEEIVRARSHLEQFRRIMGAAEAGGRKLNFLLQELNREFNTMGSKIGNAAAAHEVVAVKTELEKIREQIQNIE
jgi:uncharacterized protein (TIGR00255 family)